MSQRVITCLDVNDLRITAEKLKNIYESSFSQLTLDGRRVSAPYPVLQLGRKVIRGYPISPSYFRSITVYPHSKRVAAVDASIKVLFNCGAFKVVVSKVAWGLWRGFVKKTGFENPLKVNIVWDKSEAAEWLLKVELEQAIKVASLLGSGDYLLLDRSLMVSPTLTPETKKLFERLSLLASARGFILVGISKSTKIKLNTGESLLGYLLYNAEKWLKDVAWYYHPVFRESSLPPCYLGDIVIAKLDPEAEGALRIDLHRKSLLDYDLDMIMGEIAYMQDPATPGYPYPLESVHKSSRITRDELEIAKAYFAETLSDEGILDQFMADVKSTTVKERHLWGLPR